MRVVVIFTNHTELRARATDRGGESFELGWSLEEGWWCGCPQGCERLEHTRGACAHLLALELVVGPQRSAIVEPQRSAIVDTTGIGGARGKRRNQ